MNDQDYLNLILQLDHCPFSSSYHSGKAKCEKDWSWRPQALIDYDLWYVAAGKGEVWLNDKHYSISAGSCFLLRPGDRVAADQDPDHRLTVYFIHFQLNQAKLDIETAVEQAPLRFFPSSFVIPDTVWIETLLNRLLVLDDAAPNEVEQIEFASILRAALCVLLKSYEESQQQTSKHHAIIRRLIRFIKENPSSLLTYEQLANYAGLSSRYLNILFKKQTGVSVKTFMARTRIERACHLLAECSMNVTQIADTLGYSDIYFFSKQFKQFVGESPLRYRSRVEAAHAHTVATSSSH